MNLQTNMKGFTFLEVLISIGILGILAGVGALNLIGFSGQRNLQDDASKIAFAIRGARDKSVSQEDGSQWGVHFDNPATGVDFYEIFKGSSYPGTHVMRVNLNANVKFTSPASGASFNIIFNKSTGLPQSVNSIIISNMSGTVSKTITVNQNGEIQY